MPGVFIEVDDGYTEDFFINEFKGLHGKLSGKFRPMLPDERDTMYQKAQQKTTRVEQNAVYRRCVRMHLVEWDAVDSKGNRQQISEHFLRHLRPALWDKLMAIVAGERASDLPIDASSEVASQDSEDDDLVRAMREAGEGRTPGSRLEADAKN